MKTGVIAMKKRMLPLALTLLIVFAAACSGSGNSGTGGGGNAGTGTGSGGSTSQPASQNAGGSGGSGEPKVLRVGVSVDPTTMDPFIYTTVQDRTVIKAVFNSLVDYDLETLELKYELAESIEMSEDGLMYTVKIVPNAVFHNGKPLAAEDVKYSFEQAKRPEASRTSGLLQSLADIKIIDDHTLQFIMSAPDMEFMDTLVDVNIAPNDPSIDHSTHPIGTGPFMFDGWERNQYVRLKKNESYFREGYPKVDVVEIRTIPDRNVKLLQLRNGQLDLIDSVPFNEAEAMNNDPNLQTAGVKEPTISHIIFMNNTREPFNNKQFRQAVSYAIDRELIEDSMFGGFKATASPIPESYEGYNPNVPTYDYDPEKAKRLLAESGYNGKEVELLFHQNVDPAYDMVAQYVEQMLKNIGVNVKLVGMEIANWIEKTYTQQQNDMAMTGVGPKPNNIDFLNHHYGKLHANGIQWGNQSWYDRLAAAKKELPERAIEIVRELHMEVMEEVPAVIVGRHIAIQGLRSNVQGFLAHPQNALIFETVSVE
jgi:peptide/nickel transport system substrate-binding protein